MKRMRKFLAVFGIICAIYTFATPVITHTASAAPTVSLAWDPSPDADVTNYRLYWGPGSGNYNGSSDLGNVTNTVFTQLVPGGHYYFVVTAINAGGAESDPSNEIDFLVPGGNTPPAISDIVNQIVIVGTAIPTISFQIGDAETAAGSLALVVGSSNPTLIPVANISFGGSGANRTITVVPASGQIGVTTITVTVSDGQGGTASDTFTVTVNPNTAPNISDIADQTILVNGSTATLNFTVSDGQTAANSLVVTKTSSNPTLIPSGNIVLGGSGTGRTVRITPTANQNGTATVTLTVTDAGGLTDSTSFLVTVDRLDSTYTASTGFTVNRNSGVVSGSFPTLTTNSKSVYWAKGGLSVTAGQIVTVSGSMFYVGATNKVPVSVFLVDETTTTNNWISPLRVIFPDSSYGAYSTKLIVRSNSSNAKIYVICGHFPGAYGFQNINVSVAAPTVPSVPLLYTEQLMPKQYSTYLNSVVLKWFPAPGSQGYIVRAATSCAEIEKGAAGNLLSQLTLPSSQLTNRMNIGTALYGGVYISVTPINNGVEGVPWVTCYLMGDIFDNMDDAIPPTFFDLVVDKRDADFAQAGNTNSFRVPSLTAGQPAGPMHRCNVDQVLYNGYQMAGKTMDNAIINARKVLGFRPKW